MGSRAPLSHWPASSESAAASACSPSDERGGSSSIHQRPPTVASRRQAGHWEGDLIVGAAQRSAIATLVERKFRLTVLVPVPRDHSAQSVGDALIGAFITLPTGLRQTLTWDQGNEMFHHQRIEQVTGLKIYFADPHSPWQRPTNENTVSVAPAC